MKRNNYLKTSFSFISLAIVFFMFYSGSAMAQERVDCSVYAGAGLVLPAGSSHDYMISSGYDSKLNPEYALGGEIKFKFSSSPNTLFIKPGIEGNRTTVLYSKSSNSTREMTASYLKGGKLVKYETTRFNSSYDNISSVSYNVLVPVTVGYQFSLGNSEQCKMAIGATGLAGLPVFSRTTDESGWLISYRPFYEDGGKKVFNKQADGDKSVDNTNHKIDIDNFYYGFGGQLTFMLGKFNIQYSFRYEIGKTGDDHSLNNLLAIGFTF